MIEVRHLEAAFELSPYLCAHAQAALGIASEEPTAAVLRDPMLRVLVDLIPNDEPLVATCNELVDLIAAKNRRAVAVVGARSMATKLKMAGALLRRVGIEMRTPKQGRGRQGRRVHVHADAVIGTSATRPTRVRPQSRLRPRRRDG